MALEKLSRNVWFAVALYTEEKAGDTKALKQMQSNVSDDEVLQLIQVYFSDKYFSTLLGIEENRIAEFLNICQQQNIAQLYRIEAFRELISTLDDCSKNFD